METHHFIGRTDDGDRLYVDIKIQTMAASETARTVEHNLLGKDASYSRISFVGEAVQKGHREPYSAGQNLSEVRRVTTPAFGWTMDDIGKLIALWDQWHLNDMRAECAHMADLPANRDDRMNVRCPITGYKYGNAWLIAVPPDGIIAEVKRLQTLAPV